MRLLLAFVLLHLAFCSARAQSSSPMAPEPALEITLQPLPQPCTFHLQIMNRGKENASLIRPRSDMLDYYEQWGGWSITVKGPDGAAKPYPFPAGIGPPTALDIIELRPGESVGVVINLEHWIAGRGAPVSAWPSIGRSPGTYALTVRYHYDQEWILGKSTDDLVAVPKLPLVESSRLQFIVQN